jgi:hypothetical protein
MLHMHSLSVNVLVRKSLRAGDRTNINRMITTEFRGDVLHRHQFRLRDILCVVLYDIKAISLMDDKPSVIETG